MNDSQFDDFSQTLTSSIFPRHTLKILAAIALSSVLLLIGGSGASARQCRDAGRSCRSNAECCSGTCEVPPGRCSGLQCICECGIPAPEQYFPIGKCLNPLECNTTVCCYDACATACGGIVHVIDCGCVPCP